MKRIALLLMIVMMNVSYCQDTLPVIPFGDRKPDLYYWDTNWVDHYQHLHPNTEVYPYEGKTFGFTPLQPCLTHLARNILRGNLARRESNPCQRVTRQR